MIKIVLILVLLVAAVLIGMAGSAALIGAACAWFLHMPFVDGWHAAWDRPGILFLWGCLAGGSFSTASSSRN